MGAVYLGVVVFKLWLFMMSKCFWWSLATALCMSKGIQMCEGGGTASFLFSKKDSTLNMFCYLFGQIQPDHMLGLRYLKRSLLEDQREYLLGKRQRQQKMFININVTRENSHTLIILRCMGLSWLARNFALFLWIQDQRKGFLKNIFQTTIHVGLIFETLAIGIICGVTHR